MNPKSVGNFEDKLTWLVYPKLYGAMALTVMAHRIMAPNISV